MKQFLSNKLSEISWNREKKKYTHSLQTLITAIYFWHLSEKTIQHIVHR